MGRVFLLGVEDARALDRAAVERFGIPSIVLMENAARSILPRALALLGDRDTAIIVCGPGNNGGDGLALARHLSNAGRSVSVRMVEPPERSTGDAGVNLAICRAMGLDVRRWAVRGWEPGEPAPALVVDAMFGTGVSRGLEGAAADAAEWMGWARARGASVLSIDVPSGLDAGTGAPIGDLCVEADATVTLAGIKPGLTRLDAQRYVGELTVGDIGVPTSLLGELGEPWEPSVGVGRSPDGG